MYRTLSIARKLLALTTKWFLMTNKTKYHEPFTTSSSTDLIINVPQLTKSLKSEFPFAL